MNANAILSGIAAPLPYSNLDTDQIMPKQFLRIIDKAGLDRGLLYDLRFDAQGRPRPDCVLNQPGYAGACFLVAGPNFGCGSSREHAVWGLQQFGIRAVIAPSFGEIFFSNAMNNGLLLVSLPEDGVQSLLRRVADPAQAGLTVDVAAGRLHDAGGARYDFALSPRHRLRFVEGLDMVAASLRQLDAVARFEARHWQRLPWMKDVARQVRQRLDRQGHHRE